jgi:Tol biopolymer transport system component
MKVIGSEFGIDPNGQDPSVSDDGTLMYVTSTSVDDHLVWLDRDGTVTRVVGQPQKAMLGPVISPDGKKVAVGGFENNNWDVWIHDVDRGSKNRLTFHPRHDFRATWSPAGDTLIFESGRINDGAIFKKAADGSGNIEHIDTGPMTSYDPMWSQDGQYLTFVTWKGDENSIGDICYLAMNDRSESMIFLEGNPYIDFPALSPDSRYLAYTSNESGIDEIYVESFPMKKGKISVSVNGGTHPTWNSGGDELFYVAGDALMAIKMDTRSDFKMLSEPDMLFSGKDVGTKLYSAHSSMYDVAPDGQHFVVVQPMKENKLNVVVVQNWFKEFKEKMAAAE